MKNIPFLNKDFKSRIVVATLWGVLLSSTIFGFLVLWKSTDMSKNALETRIGIAADILASNIDVPTIFDSPQEASTLLGTAANDKAVISARLKTEENQRFAYYVNTELRDSSVNRSRLTRDVTATGEKIGTLIVEYSLDEIDQQRRNIILFLILSICFATLTTIALCLPIIQSLLSPLFSLHALSQRITQTRNYSLRAKVETPDEIGRLSKVFNSMLEQIENRDLMLEKQVSQRTHELEKLAEEFRYRAFHDILTGLPNRALLNECFESNVKKASKCNAKFGCLLLDLDDFKTINDTKGHEFGDDLLRAVAKRLKTSVGDSDVVCRLGGDEFVI
nr:diguanylate cyclase [Cellvibrionaceae bacterium]